MIKFKKIEEKREVRVIDDVLCNMCGSSLVVHIHNSSAENKRYDEAGQGMTPLIHEENENTPVVKDHDHNFYGLVEATVTGGYFSKNLSDFSGYRFSLCEPCLVKLFHSFVLPVETTDERFLKSDATGGL